VFELDFLITHLKPIRLVVLGSSWLYNSFYLTSFIWGLVLVFNKDEDEVEKYDLITIISVLMFFFDVATNAATFIINSCIILKEISLEFFQLLQHSSTGKQVPDPSIGLKDVFNAFLDFLWLINPLNWFITLWDFLFEPHKDWKPFLINEAEDDLHLMPMHGTDEL
jgi:hypothetical protein